VASCYLSNYLGWRWALDGKRVTSLGQLLRIVTKGHQQITLTAPTISDNAGAALSL